MIKKLFAGLLLAILLIWPAFLGQSANAATFKTGDSYSLGSGQSINDDLYVGSSNINISGDVIGDIFAAGGNIFISGTITEDATIAGGTVNIIATIRDDLHVAGGNIFIESSVGGDVLAAGGQVHVGGGSIITGDIIAAGGRVTIDGRVNGSVNVSGGQIVIGDNAFIGGDVSYRSGREAQISSGAIIQGIVQFNQQRFEGRGAVASLLGAWFFAKSLMLLATALLFIWLFKRTSIRIVHEGLNNFWANALRGFLVLIAAPVLIVVLFITVIGVPAGLVVLFAYIAWIILSSAIAALVFGGWLLKVLFKKDPAPVTWKSAVIGVLAGMVVAWVPFVGWLVGCIFFLVALGSLSKTWYEHVWLNR
ncbi:MAG: hypothetical protein Q8P35_03255 [Candidatus Yanofskybacteria bacterium]|nr:hypothetical protein [Candidatus Yanofskybacteria bacterium]